MRRRRVPSRRNPVAGGLDEAGVRIWLLASVCLLTAYFFAMGRLPREPALVVMVAVAVVALPVCSSATEFSAARGGLSTATPAVAAIGAFLNFSYMVGTAWPPSLLMVGGCVLCVAVVLAARTDLRIARLRPSILVILADFIALVFYLKGHAPRIDVEVVLREGVGEFLSGHNPYAMTFSNPYTPEESAAFFAPGVLVDGRISLGFPYPPAVLLAAVSGYVLGDVRLSAAVGLTLLALLVHGRGSTRDQRSQSLALALAPGLVFLVDQAWTESLSVVLLGVGLLVIRRGHVVAGAAILAAFVVSKQYLVVIAPCVLLLRPWITPRAVFVFLTTGVALVFPWAFADLTAFWKALSGAHVGGLVRSDSISILVQGITSWGWADSTAFRWLPVATGLAVAAVATALFARSLGGFAMAVGVSVLAAVLFSKQSFFNYFFLVSIALALGAVLQSFEPLSARSEADVMPDQNVVLGESHREPVARGTQAPS